MGEYRIRERIIAIAYPGNVGTGPGDKIGEDLVLFGRPARIELRAIVPDVTLGTGHDPIRHAHYDAFQGKGHRLRTECHVLGVLSKNCWSVYLYACIIRAQVV